MSPAGLRQWFEVAEHHLEVLQTRVDPFNTLAAHLCVRGFPATEMDALRAALQAVEEQLGDLQRAIYTDAKM
jgi:hypothetical protein